MSEDTMHPDELLAVYVDGDASVPERTEVESHLAGCSACREEVELARTARMALASLPELDAPDLIIDVEAAGDPVARGPVHETQRSSRPASFPGSLEERRRAKRGLVAQRLAWASGLAAAAAIAAVFVFSVGGDGNGFDRAGLATPSEEAAPMGGPAPVFAVETDYDPDSLASRADGLTLEAARIAEEGQPSLGAPATPQPTDTRPPDASPTSAVQASDQFAQDEVLACLQQGTGLVEGNLQVQVEAASFEGTEAFIGFFVDPGEDGGADALLVLAVSREGCVPLYTSRQGL